MDEELHTIAAELRDDVPRHGGQVDFGELDVKVDGKGAGKLAYQGEEVGWRRGSLGAQRDDDCAVHMSHHVGREKGGARKVDVGDFVGVDQPEC